ncbi:hypothetical protein Tco_0429387, partial [Tanacetum coccineum]
MVNLLKDGCCCPKHKQYDYQPITPFPYPIASQVARDVYEALNDAQNEAACLMLGSISPELQRILENYKAYDMIQELKTMFEENRNCLKQSKHSTLANRRMVVRIIKSVV